MVKLKALISSFRPLNSFMTGLGIVIATSLYLNWRIDPLRLTIGFTTGFLGSASAMMINDVVDKDVDAVNKPWKPIPSGVLNPSLLRNLSIVFMAIAVSINILVGFKPFISALTYGTLAYSYSYMRRHWWSHFIVSFTTTAPVIHGYILAGEPAEYLNPAVLYGLTIFTATTGREIVKAVMDIEGDRRYGYVTIPIKYGLEKTRVLILIHGVTAPVLGFLTGFYSNATLAYYTLFTLSSIIYLASMLKAYVKTSDKQTLEKTRRRTLYAMLTGLIAYLLIKT